MKKFIIILLCFSIQSCGFLKDVKFKDKTIEEREVKKSLITRPSDSISVERKYNIKLRDTTIYTTSYDTKTVMREVYDTHGNQRIDCIPEEILESIEQINEKINRDITEEKEVKLKVDLTPMIYAIVVLAIVFLIAIVLGYMMISKIKKDVPLMIVEAVKSISK